MKRDTKYCGLHSSFSTEQSFDIPDNSQNVNTLFIICPYLKSIFRGNLPFFAFSTVRGILPTFFSPRNDFGFPPNPPDSSFIFLCRCVRHRNPGVGDAKGGRVCGADEKACLFYRRRDPISPFGPLSLRAFLSREKEMRRKKTVIF